ncbi:hypothetical protein J132_01019 [Termitomyces sp. J132]|nr:hypothetical protein J132_01019 [Termitomyces sp. J132]
MPSFRTLLVLAASAATLALAMPSPASDVAPNHVPGVASNRVPVVTSNQVPDVASNVHDAHNGRYTHNGHREDIYRKTGNTTDSAESPPKDDRWKSGPGPVKLPPKQKDHVPPKSGPGHAKIPPTDRVPNFGPGPVIVKGTP